MTARKFDDIHAKAIAMSASKRGTTFLSLESVLYPCILHPLGSAKPNRPVGPLKCAFHPQMLLGSVG